MFTILDQAEIFKSASERCFEQRQLTASSFEWLPIAGIVNAAFACELFFKHLISKTTDLEVDKIHKLDELYNKLPQDMQFKIQEPYKDNFDLLLQKISNNFIAWRYLFEDLSKANADLVFIRFLAEQLSMISNNYK